MIERYTGTFTGTPVSNDSCAASVTQVAHPLPPNAPLALGAFGGKGCGVNGAGRESHPHQKLDGGTQAECRRRTFPRDLAEQPRKSVGK
ncbi:hypothetical protein Pure05_17310 [Paenarthrobacter ureafaciens]|nr:hypothetical protein Pure01_17310 [Paenarthrobacter ureafaciens]GLU63486.1 hypothetical protein Pure02_17360 [Paenarthrobacter ureafaciens]GLU67854.1 hypothetical protein Pure03_18300 [Paenarthrobacter ureafaciens]GLU72021.1 hypothetical protein Pure04_17360 [Paenarthrobacter ureafaciens]GLU76291.1 hypothetical protein Pure05_17310 [Paenarthrobacter ureafaciens]